MLLPSMPIFEAEHNELDVSLLSALLQLKQLQKASTWHCPLPLVILVPGSENGNTQKLEEGIGYNISNCILLCIHVNVHSCLLTHCKQNILLIPHLQMRLTKSAFSSF